jgi:molybdopterin molybdotransferase
MCLPTERMKTASALMRRIVEDQYSPLNLPPFNRSAMDGFAIPPGGKASERYRVLETVPAGTLPTKSLAPGTATKVMTGAAVPEGAARVVMVELAEESGDEVRFERIPETTNICSTGEDMARGALVLKAGTQLGSLEIASLISVGITEVPVSRVPRVAILSTGDELVDCPDRLTPGKIMNSNGPLLQTLCQRSGLEVVRCEQVADTLEATIDRVTLCLAEADILILSGGVSVGEFDFVPQALEHVGLTIHFDRIAVQPGKPTTFASSQEKAVFGLPGNPGAVYLMYHLFVLRAAALLAGSRHECCYRNVTLGFNYARRNASRLAYIPCQVDGDCVVQGLDYHGSAHLLALHQADGFFVVPQGVSKLSQGDRVKVMSMRGRFV